MNTDTEKNVNEAIDWLQQTGGQIQDFATEQAPLYCREVVAWELWSGIVGSVAGIALILLAYIMGKVLYREMKKGIYDERIHVLVASSVGVGVSTIMAVALLLDGVPSTIKAAVAPRLVIVEHLRGLNK